MWMGAQFELPQADLSLGDLNNGKNIGVDICVHVFNVQKKFQMATPNMITQSGSQGANTDLGGEETVFQVLSLMRKKLHIIMGETK